MASKAKNVIFPENVNTLTGRAETTDMHSLECCSMNEGEFLEHVNRMSSCQSNVLQYVKSFFDASSSIVDPKNELHLFISGEAG